MLLSLVGWPWSVLEEWTEGAEAGEWLQRWEWEAESAASPSLVHTHDRWPLHTMISRQGTQKHD